MKTLRYAVIFTAFVTCFTAKGQDRIVERDGQVIILQEGTKTDRSIIGRYIYCNDVDTAYALIVGHFYTTEEVERAFGKPQKIKDNITYENGFAFDGNISYTYDDLYLSVDCQSGLCEFRVRRENTSFYEYGRIWPMTPIFTPWWQSNRRYSSMKKRERRVSASPPTSPAMMTGYTIHLVRTCRVA